jgi:putative flippase GtrA
VKVAALIPSLNPDQLFTQVVDDLARAGFERIYLVNDGSGREYLPLFETAAAHPQCVLLTHPVNRGKGRALKTAFQHYLQCPGDFVGMVTLDGDGQHTADDVVAVAEALQARPEALVLGVRDFSGEHVPTKNALGNRVTRGIFRLACGIPVSDTQTGLRGIPNAFMEKLLHVGGERYEFETDMLLEARRAGVPLAEVPIRTIYLDGNSASHFRPLRDGLRVYSRILRFLFLKFIVSSAAGTLLDLALFALLNHWLLAPLPAAARLLAAVAGARVFSALVNFLLNYKIVFASKAPAGRAAVRYGLLCAAQAACSYGGVYLFSELLPVPAVPAKVIVDLILFLLSFQFQRRWVFAR